VFAKVGGVTKLVCVKEQSPLIELMKRDNTIKIALAKFFISCFVLIKLFFTVLNSSIMKCIYALKIGL
jgi:hypothetical protein